MFKPGDRVVKTTGGICSGRSGRVTSLRDDGNFLRVKFDGDPRIWGFSSHKFIHEMAKDEYEVDA